MDSLSRLLALHPVHTSIDTRCLFRVPWHMERETKSFGIAPYHLIVTGSAWLYRQGQKAVPLKAGDMLVFPRGSAHSLYTSSAAEARPARIIGTPASLALKSNDGDGLETEMLCGQFHFESPDSNALLGALPDFLLVRTAGRPDFMGLRTIATMLREETEGSRLGATAVMTHLASTLFSLLVRAWLEQSATVPGLFGLLAEPRLNSAFLCMLTEPGRQWSVERLAEASNMSRATFARVFQRVAGATPGDILTATRMAHAAKFLSSGQLSVGEISEAVGYRSEAAFNRAFKRYSGSGPGQYRSRVLAYQPIPHETSSVGRKSA